MNENAYKVVSKNTRFKESNGKNRKSYITLFDGYGTCRVVNKDDKYALLQHCVDGKDRYTTYFFPEAFNAMKRYLPSLPVDKDEKEQYKVIARNTKYVRDDGEVRDAYLTLSNRKETYYIGEDDSCYVVVKQSDKVRYEYQRFIPPEVFNAMKKYLPYLKSH